MSILTDLPPSLPWYARLFYKLPVIGWLARDVAFGDEENIYYFLVILLTVVVLATATWGLPALVMTALAYVPIHFALMIMISSPWN